MELAEYAMGWLGWSEADAMAADVSSIKIGWRGRYDMINNVLKVIVGKAVTRPGKPPVSSRFREWSREHNVIVKTNSRRARK